MRRETTSNVFCLSSSHVSRLTSQTTTNKGKAITSNKREEKQRSVNRTLISREFRHYFSSAMYILNTSIGYIFLPIIGVLALVNRDVIHNAIIDMASASTEIPPEAFMSLITAFMPVLVLAAVILMSGTGVLTAPSISLEGRKISILQSLPIPMKQILWAKIEFHCIVALPLTLISVILISIGLSLDAFNTIALCLASVAVTLFYGVFGLVCNLKWNILDWKNENLALKQSMPILICMLVGFLGAVALSFPYLFLTIIPSAFSVTCIDTYITARMDRAGLSFDLSGRPVRIDDVKNDLSLSGNTAGRRCFY